MKSLVTALNSLVSALELKYYGAQRRPFFNSLVTALELKYYGAPSTELNSLVTALNSLVTALNSLVTALEVSL